MRLVTRCRTKAFSRLLYCSQTCGRRTLLSMKSQEFVAHPELARDIQLIWMMELSSEVEFGPPTTVLPDGIVEIIFHYGSPFRMQVGDEPSFIQPRSLAVSQTHRPIHIAPTGPSGFLSVRFFPWGAHQYFDLPVHEFADRTVSTEHLWGPQARALEDEIGSASTMRQRVRILERFLISQRRSRRVDNEALIRKVVSRRGRISVRELASGLGLGERQIERRFRDSVGVSPKHFARLCRFLSTCHLLSNRQPTTTAEVALQAGFFDQAHLHHDFVAFSGMTPSAFAQEQGISFLEL